MRFDIGRSESKYLPGVEARLHFSRPSRWSRGGEIRAGLGYNPKMLPAHAREELEWEDRVERRLASGLPIRVGALSIPVHGVTQIAP